MKKFIILLLIIIVMIIDINNYTNEAVKKCINNGVDVNVCEELRN